MFIHYTRHIAVDKLFVIHQHHQRVWLEAYCGLNPQENPKKEFMNEQQNDKVKKEWISGIALELLAEELKENHLKENPHLKYEVEVQRRWGCGPLETKACTRRFQTKGKVLQQ